MTVEQFERQMGRLSKQWPKSYAPERIALIWSVVGGLAEEVFSKIVSDAISAGRGAPTPQQIQEASIGAQQVLKAERFKEWRQTLGRNYQCPDCEEGVAWLVRHAFGEERRAMARCHCPLGDGLPAEWPRIARKVVQQEVV